MKEREKEKKLENLEEIIKQVHGRGNDIEIRETKEGKKVYEVSRKLIGTIKL